MLENPYRAGGAEAVYEMLAFLCEHLPGDLADVSSRDELAEAAYFYSGELKSRDPQRYRKVLTTAAQMADDVVSNYRDDAVNAIAKLKVFQQQQFVRNCLISARMHEQQEGVANAQRGLPVICAAGRLFLERHDSRSSHGQFFTARRVLQPSAAAEHRFDSEHSGG